MRLPGPSETRGSFWLPHSPDEQIQGVLSISTSGTVTLELSGILGGALSALERGGVMIDPPRSGSSVDIRRIIGTTELWGAVTLDRCFETGSRIQLSGQGISTTTVVAGIAIAGAHYDPEEEIVFSQVSATIEGLAEWVRISGITLNPQAADDMTSLNIERPQTIPFGQIDTVVLELEFPIHFSAVPRPISEITIRQDVRLNLIVEQPQPIEFFVALWVKICHYISLAVDEPVTASVQAIRAVADAHEETSSRRVPEVELYGEFAPWTDTPARIRPNEVLFWFDGIAHRIDEVIGNWLKTYDSLGPAIDLYFACQYQSTQYVDFKVLWLSQALESWHRTISSDLAVTQAEFEELMSTLLQNCPEQRRDWLRNRLKHANELSLRRRMTKLVQQFSRWFGNYKRREGFVRLVVATRDYQTHLTKDLEQDAAKGDDLILLYNKLRALFQLLLLQAIGFREEVIDKIVEANARLGTTLKQ